VVGHQSGVMAASFGSGNNNGVSLRMLTLSRLSSVDDNELSRHLPHFIRILEQQQCLTIDPNNALYKRYFQSNQPTYQPYSRHHHQSINHSSLLALLDGMVSDLVG
jgi:hypothetical protein